MSNTAKDVQVHLIAKTCYLSVDIIITVILNGDVV